MTIREAHAQTIAAVRRAIAAGEPKTFTLLSLWARHGGAPVGIASRACLLYGLPEGWGYARYERTSVRPAAILVGGGAL